MFSPSILILQPVSPALGISIIALTLGILPGAAATDARPVKIAVPTLRTDEARIASHAWRLLWEAFDDRQAGWTRVHAAEALSALGQDESVRARLTADLSEWQRSAQRIGAWRVLAATSKNGDERRRWISEIERVAHERGAPDRLQAIETLGKLGHVVSSEALPSVRELMSQIAEADALFPAWVLHLAGEQAGTNRLIAAFTSPIPDVRRRAAFISRRLNPLPASLRMALVQLVETESTATVAYPYAIAAALALDLYPDRRDFWRGELERIWNTATGSVRLEVCQVLMPRLPAGVIPRWISAGIEAPDLGTRVASAWTALHLLTRADGLRPGQASPRE